MTLLEIAEIYTDLVNAENEIPAEELNAKERINLLRTKYHDRLMDQMSEEGIYFADRFDATRKAFEIAKRRIELLYLYCARLNSWWKHFGIDIV